MFSALRLADGDLTVYDLEHLGGAPRVIVLSACESGVSAARPGDELLGLVTALCSLGTDAVVASVVPVPDLDTTSCMVELHRGLASGATPAAALAAARSSVDNSTPTGFVTSLAFSCFGRP
jgi:CHAT domain-containing protein